MQLGPAVDRGIIRRRAGSELRAFCPRGHNGISSLVWIKGKFALLFVFEEAFVVRDGMWGIMIRGSKRLVLMDCG